MIMTSQQQQIIKDSVEEYNRPDFITRDPIYFPHRYTKKTDIEISAILTSWISLGNRKAIVKKSAEMDQLFAGDPTGYVLGRKWSVFSGSSDTWYRFYKAGDFASICAALADVYEAYSSVEDLVVENIEKMDLDLLSALYLPFAGINGFADPSKGSACKRLCMLLRWLVRRDGIVDLGIWTRIDPKDLIVPVDTHVYKTALKYGLTDRKTADRKTAEEITSRLRTIYPEDPAVGDFALFGLGIDPRLNGPIDPISEETASELNERLNQMVEIDKKETKDLKDFVEASRGSQRPEDGTPIKPHEPTAREIAEAKRRAIVEAKKEVEAEEYRKINEAIEANKTIIVAATYNILFANKIAAIALKQVKGYLDADGLYKMEVKKQIDDIERATDNFERITYSVYGDRAKFFDESVDRMVKDIKLDIEKLFFSIKSYLDKLRINHSGALARMEWARTLVSLAVEIHKTRIAALREKAPALPSLDYLSMDRILYLVDNLSKRLNREIPVVVDLNEDRNTLLSVRIIDQKLGDGTRIAKAVLLTN